MTVGGSGGPALLRARPAAPPPKRPRAFWRPHPRRPPPPEEDTVFPRDPAPGRRADRADQEPEGGDITRHSRAAAGFCAATRNAPPNRQTAASRIVADLTKDTSE